MTNVNIDSGTITGITDLAVADGGTGLSTVATSNILTGNGTGALTAESTLTFDGSTLAVGGDITFSDTNTIGTSTFVSGITGDGFRVQDNGSSGTLLEVDNVVVRNTLRTHIFQKDVVKATNGILFVSDSGVISGSNGSNSITFVDAKSATFSNNQQLWYKDIDEDTGNIVSVKFSINGSADTSVSGMSTYAIDGIIPSGAAPYLTGSMGGTAVRISGGSLVLDASSNNSPYMDVNSGGSGSAVVRTGNLAGITSPKFGALTGEYGLWASGSAYLEGSINATSGEIGGWTIGTNLSATNMRLNPSDSIELGTATTYALGNGIFLGNDGTARFGNAAAARFQWDLTNVEIYNSSNQKLVSLGGTNEIVGWELVPGRFQYDSSAGSIALDATSQQISIHTGSINTAKPKVVMGKLPRVGGSDDDDRYGFAVFSGTDNASILDDTTYSVLITKDKARLAGWDLIPGNIQSDNTGGSVRLSSISQSLTIWTGSMDEAQPKLVLGKLPLHDGTVDSPYGFAVFSGSGVVSGSQASASVLITANKARLAGWELGPGQLTSGTVATIDGNQAKIALGTNATTHTGMSPSASLFFVSASADPIFFVGENFSYVGDVLKAGGWTIGDGVITGGNATLAAAGYLSLGTGTAGYANSTTRIYIDGVNQRMSIGTGFKYTGGSLTIDGNATIGGWTIGSTLSATNILLDPATPKITLGSKATLTDSNTGLYLGTDGLALGASSVFKVTAAGALTATSATITGAITATSGEIGGLTVSSDKLYVGTGTHNNSNTAFYVEDDGKFSLKDKLVWDGSDLSIQGSITITGGSGFATAASVSGSFDDKGSAAGAVTASAADATTKANAAQSAAASDATTKANAAEAAASASAAVGTAAAQAAIDTMETQLVLDSGGMGLWSSGGVASGFLVADYGTTTKFYDGVDDLAANVKLQLNASGITAYGDNTTTYATFDSSGMTIVDNSVTAGTFTSGTVTLYGASSNDRVVINNTGMSVYTANVLKATALDAGFTAYGDDVNTYATVTSTGLTIFEDSTNMANFGSTVRVGEDETDKSALRVAADGSMSIGVKDGTPKFSVTAAGVVSIEGSMTITGGTGFATPASVSGSFDDKGSAAGAVTASAADATTKANAAQSAAISTAASDATTKADAAETAASASAAVGTAAAQLAIDTMETQVVLDSNGMGLWNAAGTVQVSEYGTTSTFWDGVGHADTNRKLELNASGITLWGGAAAGNDYLNLAAGSLSMYSNNVRTLHITDHGINIGKSATGPSGDGTPSAVIGNISLHSGGARIYGDTTTTYAEVTSAGLSVYEDTLGSATSMANFGSTMRIGVNATDKSALRVAADGTLTIGTSSTTNVTISSAGALTITGEVNASSGTFSGGLTLSGNLTAGGAKFGTNVASTNDGLYLTSTNHWYDSGVLTTDNILATGGSVGGWELESNILKSSYASKDSEQAISASFQAGSTSDRVTKLSISSLPIPGGGFNTNPETRFDLSVDDANFKHSASYVEAANFFGKNAKYELDVGDDIHGAQILLEANDTNFMAQGEVNESVKIGALNDTGSFVNLYVEDNRWITIGTGSFAGTSYYTSSLSHGITLESGSFISGSLEGSASFGTVMTNTIQTTPKPPTGYYNDNIRFLASNGAEFMRFHQDLASVGAVTINSGSHGSYAAPYLDFRVLSISNDNMLFVENFTNKVGIGTGDPGYTLDVAGDIRVTDDMFVNDDLTVSGKAKITEKITSTAGITFGSDTAAANTLHDYEEGDWTPTLNVSGTATTSAGCHYVKIGSLVTCWMKLSNIQESSTQTADFIITGLPFTVEFSCTGGNMMANGFNFVDDPDNVNNLTLHVTTSEEVKIYETKDGGSAWDAVTWGDITDNDDIYGQFTYRTTQ
jgi:hypothetical protein